MFIDQVHITIKGGDGGNGAVSFKRNALTAMGGPDGGNGGNGGSVYVQGSTNISDLREFQYKKVIQAADGVRGNKNNLFGKNAPDLLILLPVGTAVIDTDTNETIEIVDNKQKFCIAKGGVGGKGNNEFKTATNQSPEFAEKGEKGEKKQIFLKLRIIADIGFVGFPNVGKSTLLSLLTNAKPKIGNYAFTTLEPNVGVMKNIVLADIPGIIKDASKGKGLGIKFLQHIEKTKVLFYCLDSTEIDPYKTYEAIQTEFKEYNPELLEKKEVIVLTKTDLVEKEKVTLLKKQFKGKKVVAFSQYDESSVEELRKLLEKFSV